MELSKRMQMNADLVSEGSRVADIGCDHGYVSIYLAQQKKCPKVIAMDVNEGPLQIAKGNIVRERLEGQIDCRLSDGLEKIVPGEVDTVLIAGVGGMLICRILQRNPEVLVNVKDLVLQPQSDCGMVRRLLSKLNFKIIKEDFCIDEGKPYLAVRAVRSDLAVPVYSESEYCYGKMSLQQNPLEYKAYLLGEKEKILHIIEKLNPFFSDSSKTRREELLHTLKCINEILVCSEMESK